MVSVAEARAISANNCVLPDEVEKYVSNKIMTAANNGDFFTSVCFSWDMYKSKYSTYAKITACMLEREGYDILLNACIDCAQVNLGVSWNNE